MILETLFAGALVPAVIDFFKGAGSAVSRKWLGLSVDDEIKLANASVAKLEALSKLDNPYGTPSEWVVNLRASFRYIAALVVIIIGCLTLMSGVSYSLPNVVDMGYTLVGLPFSFIFGERLILGLRGPGSK
jgi:hypothetical protein